jgi:hypothetical protein
MLKDKIKQTQFKKILKKLESTELTRKINHNNYEGQFPIN